MRANKNRITRRATSRVQAAPDKVGRTGDQKRRAQKAAETNNRSS